MKILSCILAIFVCMSFAEKTTKPTLVEFYADWCIPCIEMQKTVFKDKTVKAELKNFNFIRIDTEKDQSFFCEGENFHISECMELWEVQGIPAFAVLDSNGSIKHLTTGSFDKKTFLQFLRKIK